MSRAARWVSRSFVGLTISAFLCAPTPLYAAVSSSVGAGAAGMTEPLAVATHATRGPIGEPTRDGTADEPALLSLPIVVERARIHHPDVTKANAAALAAERELVSREAAFAPRASVDSTPVQLRVRQGNLTQEAPSLRLSASQSTRSGLSASASLSVTVKNQALQVPTWSFSLSYPLLRSAELNSNNMSIRQAEINLESAYSSRVRAEASAIIHAIQLYHAAITSATRLNHAIATLDEARSSSEAVFRRVDLGMATEIDRINAETELRRQELAVVQAERTYHDRMRSLLNAVGLSYTPYAYELAGWPQLEPPADGLSLEDWIIAARPFDATVWQREVAIETAELQLRAEVEKNRLEAGISGGVSKGSTQQTPGSQDDPTPNWNIQLQLSYPLADGGARQRALEDRQDSLREAQQAFTDELRAFELRIKQMMDSLHDARVNADLAELTYKKAEMEWAHTQAGVARGFGTELDLSRSRRTLERAYDDLQSAILDVYSALWTLESAAGMNLDLSAFVIIDEAW